MKKAFQFYCRVFIALILTFALLTSSPGNLIANDDDSSVTERILVTKEIKMKRYGSPEEFDVPVGASFEVLEYGREKNKVYLFDASGAQIQGVYEISTTDLQDYVHLQSMGDDLSEDQSAQAQKDQRVEEEEDDTSENGLVAGQDFPILPENDMGDYMPEEDRVDEGFAPTADICTLYKKFAAKGVPAVPLKQALFYYKNHMNEFSNKRWVSFADYSQRSTKRRFYLLDMQTGDLQIEKVSHGSGSPGGTKKKKRFKKNKKKSRMVDDSSISRGLASANGDPNRDGVLDRCSQPGISSGPNKDKNMTRVGFFKTLGTALSPSHRSKWPWLSKGRNKMILRGLSPTNREAEGDGVVMHEAFYNRGGDAPMGMSWGCPAFVPGRGAPIVRKIQGGSLFYGYAPACANEMKQVKAQINGWESFCGTDTKENEKSDLNASEDDEIGKLIKKEEENAKKEKENKAAPVPSDVALPTEIPIPRPKPPVPEVKKAITKKVSSAKKKAPVKISAKKKTPAKKGVKKRRWDKKQNKYIYYYASEYTEEDRKPASNGDDAEIVGEDVVK